MWVLWSDVLQLKTFCTANDPTQTLSSLLGGWLTDLTSEQVGCWFCMQRRYCPFMVHSGCLYTAAHGVDVLASR